MAKSASRRRALPSRVRSTGSRDAHALSLDRREPGWQRPPVAEDPPIDASLIVALLFQQKWQVLLVAALVLIPTVVVTLLQERLYSATALLQIDPEPMQLLPNGNVDVPRPPFDVYMRTQEQVLFGPTLLARVGERLAEKGVDPAMAQEAPALERRYASSRLEGTQMLTVRYLAPNPQVAANVANLFADEFIRLQFESQQESRDNARELLERDLRRVEEQIQSSERELVAYSQQHAVEGARPDRRNLADDRLVALSSRILEIESELVSTTARVDALQTASVTDFPDTLMTEVLRSRLSTLLQLERELTALRTTFGESWPAVVQKRDEIAVVREQIDREKTAVLEQARSQARLEQLTAQGKLTSIRSARVDQEGRVNQLQNSSIQYNILQRNVETNRKLYEGLLERLKQLSVAPGMDLASARVIERAIPIDTVASPRILWNVFLALVLGVALGVSVVLARDYWINSFSTVEEVEHVTTLPVLAAIPLLRQPATGSRSLLARAASALRLGGTTENAGPSELVPAGPDRAGRVSLGTDFGSTEAVRSLCASLLLSRSERPPRVVVVTSALAGEGKTTVSLELGRALAESGARTLLVEGDLRRPQLASEFGIGPEGGLSLFLAGLSQGVTVHDTSQEKLSVVSAGPATPNPMALLSSGQLDVFIREMASTFQFVIIDTPPAVPIADARLFGAKADGVVLVVRAGHTSRLSLRRVCAVLDDAGCTMLGAVINAVHGSGMRSSYYGYGYDYKPT